MNRGNSKLLTVLEPEVYPWQAVLVEIEERAIRERLRGDSGARRLALEAAIGTWADRVDLLDTEAYIQGLRDDDRVERLAVR